MFNTGEQVEEGGMGVLLRLIDLPTTEGLSADTVFALRKHLLSASIRIQVAVAWVSSVFEPLLVPVLILLIIIIFCFVK